MPALGSALLPDAIHPQTAVNNASANATTANGALQVICAWPVSGQYGPGTRVLYYVLIAACVFARKTDWLRNACLAAVLLFPAVAALHGVVIAALNLHGLLSLTVEFFRIQPMFCPFDDAGNAISPDARSFKYNTNCGLICSEKEGPFSPMRDGAASNIYVIPAPDKITFGTATLMAAACCVPAILSLISMWNKILEINRMNRFGLGKPKEQVDELIEGTNGATIKKMNKVNSLVRLFLSAVEIPVLGAAVMGILILGEMNFFSSQVLYQTEPRDYAPDYHKIPAHGRWHHFDVGGRPRINQLLQSWPSTIDTFERTRRLIDLFLISVLLDAGSGSRWSYKSKESGKIYRRSEGLAVASLEMFKTGLFSSDPTEPCQVDGAGLKKITVELLAKGMQHSEQNPLPGLEGRAGLLIRLSEALNNQELFGVDARPGNMLDYLLSHDTTLASSVPIISIPTLWSVLMDGLSSIWPPSRTQIDGVSIGDAWRCSTLASSPTAKPWESIVPFHKLTQWLCYSLMAPMTKVMNIQFSGSELLTGLPEYRNGGLLIDMGLLILKPKDLERGLEAYKSNAMIKGQPNMEVVPLFAADDDVIVEWRALTVGFLDELLEEVNSLLELGPGERLSLAQMLEAGTWKGGREIAEVSRPNTKEPPIMILSDGTVF
ncbi:hypothetical protein ACJ72_04575 [Emergomyces africanus]|uniref:DUF1688 domain-containing protein n=1 Tax=Emergomyces africanus TaxID=1955775 RepID=A0A1B7NWC7_9EURO|nr:hypothetical protein ACJ72_04575 [Emergomyces africanus]